MTARGQWADAQTILRRGVSEKELSQWIVDQAHQLGWRVSRTPTWRPTGTDPGMVDLVLVRGGVVLLCELKSERGKLSPAQEDWQREAGTHHRLWNTDSWYDGVIERELRR